MSAQRDVSGTVTCRRLGVQRLDHLVGDVDARAGEHRFLQDQVVLLGLEDLLDDLVGALDDRGELLVLALVQVFLELAALALEVAVLLDQLALAPAALGLGQRRRVLVELVGRAFRRLAGSVEFLLALAELGFELGLRGLGRRWPRAARGRC